MPQSHIFRWRDGSGWLVLSGGGPRESDDVLNIEVAMLGRTLSLGPIAYIWAAGDVDDADEHMDVLRDLGARTGYPVDILAEDDEALTREIGEAGVIILGDGPQSGLLRDALPGVTLSAIEDAFSRGTTVYAIGASAALFGAYSLFQGELAAGFDWLVQAIIMPDYDPEQADTLRAWVQRHPEGYGLGLGRGAALALGPHGEIELWGNAAITVSLGQRYQLEE